MICTPKIRRFGGAYFLCRLETVFKIYNDNVSLSPVLDLYNREVISYCISLSPNLQRVRDMLTGLIAKASGNGKTGIAFRSRRQYQHTEYQRFLPNTT